MLASWGSVPIWMASTVPVSSSAAHTGFHSRAGVALLAGGSDREVRRLEAQAGDPLDLGHRVVYRQERDGGRAETKRGETRWNSMAQSLMARLPAANNAGVVDR